MNRTNVFYKIAAPLASRKVRIALATVIVAYAAQWGLNVSDEMVFTILGVGVSLILGIAHEDAGRNLAAGLNDEAPKRPTANTR